MFIDYVSIEIEAGKGGNGSVAFRREKYVPRGGPSGGDGGHGGSVVIEATSDLTTLASFRFKKKFSAQAGVNGMSHNKHGKNGEDLIIRVPVGTILTDEETKRVLADMDTEGQQVVLARGGKGGRGNARFATSVIRAPKNAEMGLQGESYKVRMELKLMADVGLIGYPNVGKSTILSVISAARPKIGDFPFTTITPNLGVVHLKDKDQSFVAADIPGLIEGAHEGKGLGHQFLRHIERTRLLVHVIDIASVEGRDPIQDFHQINHELNKFNPRLAELPQLVVLNKIDLLEDQQPIQRFKDAIESLNLEVYEVSAAIAQGTDKLVYRSAQLLKDLPRVSLFTPEPESETIQLTPEQGIIIEKHAEDVYIVSGRRVDILAAKTDFNNDEGILNFYRVAKKMGVFEMLRKQGIQSGDTVVIGEMEFTYE